MTKSRKQRGQFAQPHFWIMCVAALVQSFVFIGVFAAWPTLAKALQAIDMALMLIAYQLGVVWRRPEAAPRVVREPAVPPPLPPPEG